MAIENLKELRKEQGLTQMEIARQCGVSLNSYIHWESGVTNPTPENESKLKNILNID